MKILSPGFSAANQLEMLNELNLKEGQRVVGRISSFNNDEAVLELAGRSIHAKVEGFLPAIGTIQTFFVTTDEQGRTVLRIPQNPQENSNDTGNLNANTAVEDNAIQKSIIEALNKENLPVNNENIIKITHDIQDFEAKYQQPIPAKAFTFIMAQKWPVTPATILTSLVFQEAKARAQLWDQLRKILVEHDTSDSLFSQLSLNQQANTREIADKLKLLTGFNPAKAKSAMTAVNAKGQTDNEARKIPTGDNSDIQTHREKIESILEQNIAVNKTILKETTVSGHCNLIPLLIDDSQSNVRECMVKWKEEKSGNKGANYIQTLKMTIPTVNLGDIDLVLRSSSNGIRVNLQVNSDTVRKYFLDNASELKSMFNKDNTTISIDLKENNAINTDTYGVDLWM